ncbi:MAG TPA: transposase [Gaiellales bacterium]|jgi:REP element-mobilizing transposase RayT|nr:transposase [Gaiellales bacterium]
MARPLREDSRGAAHHIFVRGVGRTATAIDAADYDRALFLLERTVKSFELECHSWCYLPNHTHLVVTSRLGNLSDAMHWLGTCTAQSFNRRYDRSGHLYQGRFGSRLVEDEAHLLELARYLPLNPVSANLCDDPEDWPWSSYAATIGMRAVPWFLSAEIFLDHFRSVDDYAAWVAQGVDPATLDTHGIPTSTTHSPSLSTVMSLDRSDAAIARAHFDNGFSQRAIARHLGVSSSQINRRLGHLRGRGT